MKSLRCEGATREFTSRLGLAGSEWSLLGGDSSTAKRLGPPAQRCRASRLRWGGERLTDHQPRSGCSLPRNYAATALRLNCGALDPNVAAKRGNVGLEAATALRLPGPQEAGASWKAATALQAMNADDRATHTRRRNRQYFSR